MADDTDSTVVFCQDSHRGTVSSPALVILTVKHLSFHQNPSKHPLPKKTKYPIGVWREKPTALGRDASWRAILPKPRGPLQLMAPECRTTTSLWA